MQIVIDIPEADYKFIQDLQYYNSGRRSGRTIEQNVINGIRNGKPYEDRPQGEWIPTSERLPDDMQRVLIWFEYYRYGDFNCMYQTYGFGYVCDGKWSPFINGETGWQDHRVIAWQPLPDPYKKGGANND